MFTRYAWRKNIFVPLFIVFLMALVVGCAAPATPTPVSSTTMPTVASAATVSADSTPSPVEVVWKSTQETKPLSEPSGLAFDKQGNLYVIDSGYPLVVKYNSKGEFVALFGFSIGSGNGQFVHTQDGGDLIVDEQNNMYITDGGNSRVQKFDGEGKFVMAFGTKGKGDGEFGEPISIAIDSQGNLLVLDVQDARIQKFDRTGKFIAQYGGLGKTQGLFSSPFGIILDSADNMYIADRGNGRVQKLDRNGKFLAEWLFCGPLPLGRPIDIAIDAQGNMYVVDDGNNRVCKYDREGKYLTSWGGRAGSADGELNDPFGIVVDDAGNVYVAEWGNKRIQEFKQR